jgi:hypothetical protein
VPGKITLPKQERGTKRRPSGPVKKKKKKK